MKSNKHFHSEHHSANLSSDAEFYKNCAIAAMQGIQEASSKAGVLMDIMPKELAKKAFDIADHMLEELHHRKSFKTYLK